jgi:RHS repeat-associated protein
VVGITDQQEGLSSRAMGYDGLDRLTAANGIWGSGSFGYDGLDNLRTSVVGARTAVAAVDAANRLSSLTVNGAVQGYGYDANGNLTQRGGQGFGFDIGNRLVSAPGQASYAYDGHGRRTWVAYANGASKLQVYGSAGKLLWSGHSSQGNTKHVYLGDRLIAEANTVSGVSYSHTDALGSPVARTNAAAQITSRTRYEAYGATAAGTNPTGIGFTGHVNDADTGLVYMQQRYYEPVAGRFLSVDPLTTEFKSGDHFNRYVYANSNPFKFKDPDGRVAFFAVPVIDIVISAVAQRALYVGTAAAVGAIAASQSGQSGGKGGAGAPAPAAGAPEAGSGGKGSTLSPGSSAGDSIPARGPGRDFTPGERGKINDIGNASGCHTCGSKEPGTKSGNFVPDHQPPNGLNPDGGPQRLYPQCLKCSQTQGGEVRGAKSGNSGANGESADNKKEKSE